MGRIGGVDLCTDQHAFCFQGMLIPGSIWLPNDVHAESVAERKKQEQDKLEVLICPGINVHSLSRACSFLAASTR